MQIFKFTLPGIRPRLSSDEEAMDAGQTLRVMGSHLASVAVSLHLFDQAANVLVAAHSTAGGDWDQRRAEEETALHELLGELERGRPTPFTFEECIGARIALQGMAAQRAAEKRWAAGVWPETYRHQAPFTHATAFVHVLNVFGLLLKQIADRWGSARPGLEAAKNTFENAIPDLKGVRDSLAHLDERLKKEATIGRRTYKIDCERWEIGGLANREFRILILSGKADPQTGTIPGRVGSIPITFGTVEAARAALQTAIDAFEWEEGPHQFEPR